MKLDTQILVKKGEVQSVRKNVWSIYQWNIFLIFWFSRHFRRGFNHRLFWWFRFFKAERTACCDKLLQKGFDFHGSTASNLQYLHHRFATSVSSVSATKSSGRWSIRWDFFEFYMEINKSMLVIIYDVLITWRLCWWVSWGIQGLRWCVDDCVCNCVAMCRCVQLVDKCNGEPFCEISWSKT